MKKLMFVAVFGMALGLTSCGADDVIDLIDDAACETQTLANLEAVNAAITAYEAAPNAGTCESLKSSIQIYRDFECIADDAFAAEFDALAEDCSTL